MVFLEFLVVFLVFLVVFLLLLGIFLMFPRVSRNIFVVSRGF